MHPKIVDVPFIGIPINSYGLMIMVGFLIAVFIAIKRGKAIEFKSDTILDIGVFSMIFGIIGAKINYIIQYHKKGELDVFNISDGGLNPIGAIILGLLPFAYISILKKGPYKISFWKFTLLCFLTLLFAIIGGRALYLIQNAGDYNWSLLKAWNSGFVFYGGIISAIIAGIITLKTKGVPVLKFADFAAPFIMLGHAFGRIGCFLNGCCFGKLCDLPWAVKFPRGSPVFETHLQQDKIPSDDTVSLAVHPTQIYDFLAALFLFFLLSYFWRKKKRDGETLILLGVFYPIWRFFVEFLREHTEELIFGALSFSQVVSIIIFIICIVWLIILKTRSKTPLPEQRV